MTLPQPANLAFGSAGLGNLHRAIDDATAQATVVAALAAGIELFDTAPHYGFGLAERRLGAALAASPEGRRARVSTKVGRRLVATSATGTRHGFVDADPFEPVFDYSRNAVLRGFEASLGRLRRDRVDTLLVHDLGVRTHGSDDAAHRRKFLDEGYRAMEELRAGGAAGRLGIGVNEVEVCLELLEEVPFEVILLAGRYTLLDQQALDLLLPLCAERGIAVLIGGPFNSGILAGDDGHGSYDYAPPPDPVVHRAAVLRAACKRHGTTLRAAALAFCAAGPAVEAVVAGLSSPAEVAEAVRSWNTPVPASLWDDLKQARLIDPASPVSPAPAPPPQARALRLHPDDNIAIAVGALAQGAEVAVDQDTLAALDPVEIGHKIALADLAEGTPIIKYGAPIGVATAAIRKGAHVHVHNLASLYRPRLPGSEEGNGA